MTRYDILELLPIPKIDAKTIRLSHKDYNWESAYVDLVVFYNKIEVENIELRKIREDYKLLKTDHTILTDLLKRKNIEIKTLQKNNDKLRKRIKNYEKK